MKYSYKISMFFAQMFLGYLVTLPVLFVLYLVDRDIPYILKLSLGALGIMVFTTAAFYKEYKNKHIEMLESYVRFNSFRFRDATQKKALVFNVKYKDIYGLGVKALPIIGVWAIVVEAKYLPHGITISFCFKNHKELCRNLCRIVKEHNPDAYIDSRLEKYCEE